MERAWLAVLRLLLLSGDGKLLSEALEGAQELAADFEEHRMDGRVHHVAFEVFLSYHSRTFCLSIGCEPPRALYCI